MEAERLLSVNYLKESTLVRWGSDSGWWIPTIAKFQVEDLMGARCFLLQFYVELHPAKVGRGPIRVVNGWHELNLEKGSVVLVKDDIWPRVVVVTLYQREITLGFSWIGSCVMSALTGTESLGLGASMLHKFPAVVFYATGLSLFIQMRLELHRSCEDGQQTLRVNT